ncbi:MAG: hypothetical protein HY221_02505 [Candidatus Sungbacteria bacterium]|uniref:Tetratricopeptide repeat protein n=1 Tax=Candidatus Sungiibacteriota bacterium TaxID=2750080 RepID=A0A932VRZ5_9BACT|nr:hypothetical protein [Candidatus Sungbacteria bacterium]
MFTTRYTPWIAGFILVIGLFAGILLRGRISHLLDFGSGSGVPAAAGIPAHSVVASSSVPRIAVQPVSGVASPVSPLPHTSAPLKSGFPPYSGRDPGEVRPVPEEVLLFTQDQKNQIYAAIENEGKAVKANPAFFNGWIHIGLLKKNIGDFEGARDVWEYAGVIEPLNSLSFANLGDLYWRYLHDYPRAEKNLKISIAHKPSDTATYITLADLYYYSYTEKASLAPQPLLDGLAANPGDENLMRHLGFIYERQGNFSDALVWWEKILTLHPADQKVQDIVNALKQKLGTAS